MDVLAKFFQCFSCWKVEASTDEELGGAQIALGQSFGLLPGNKPGRSNENMAEVARDMYWKFKLPLVLQWEIAKAISYVPKNAILLVIEKNSNGEYLDTHETIRQQLECCKEKGWTKIVMIAHPLHMWRCIMTAQKIAQKIGLEIEVYVANVTYVDYDERSIQIWTRGPMRFISREILARLYYLATGKI